MKNLIYIAIIAVIFAGCEKMPDGVVDPRSDLLKFSLTKIDLPDTLIYGVDDSVVTIIAEIENAQNVDRAYFDILNSTGESINTANRLKDDGDLINYHDSTAGDSKFSAFITFSNNDQSGNYYFKFYAYDLNSEYQLLGEKRLTYFNAQPKLPPVIFNLSMPDSVNRGTEFKFSVQVSDPNGLDDIKSGGVYYRLFNPSGTLIVNSQGISEFPLSDSGDESSSGDVTANDGIFTQKLTFPTNQSTGKWKFEFQAVDKSDSLSNKIVHELLVK